MIIINDTFVPYEFSKKEDCLKYIIDRCHGIKKSLRFVEMDIEHLCVRCPISCDYLDICGTENELNWVHAQLSIKQWYRST